MAASGSSEGPAKQAEEDEPDAVDAMGRKVWDKEFYENKAKNNIMFGPERIGRRKDPVIPLPSSQRTYLKQRSIDLNLDKDIGKARVVTAHTIKPMQGGYWCSVCECLLKDSSTYLEHVNGRRHNRNLGMNMKVEKVGVDRVKEKLRAMRKEPEAIEAVDIEARIQALEEEQEEKKRRKKEKKKRKKKGGANGAEAGDDDDAEDGEITGDERPEKKQKVAGEDGEDDDDDEEAEETEEMKMLKMMGLPTGFG
eukprot:TRINITY_DN38640_c0_g1_i1.p1 TRINITY_DN38640_c0_g1~~TRINITY_DN38640_c0_g1_i1.p1  ORF type:complete len:252 (-),score=99.39 TRINITY_DN38640_c0_g1_i1:229-984(-)